MTRLDYAFLQGVMTAVFAMYFGLMSDNPHWLTLNVPLGFLAGFLFGLLAWTLRNWLRGGR